MQAQPKAIIFQNWLVGLAMLLALTWPSRVLAHGGNVSRLTDFISGPYRFSVWSAPEPSRVGIIHVSVAVALIQPVADQTAPPVAVQILMTPVDSAGPQLSQRATEQWSLFQQTYVSDLAVAAAGQWQVHVIASGAAGAGAARFTLDVLPAQRVDWTIVFWSAVALFAAVWAVGVVRGEGGRVRQ